MILIWGFRRKVHKLAVMTYLCGRCGNPAAHPLYKTVRWFTLFFIPLIPVSTKYLAQCTFCGQTTQMTREQAEGAVATVAAPAAETIPAPDQLADPAAEHPAS